MDFNLILTKSCILIGLHYTDTKNQYHKDYQKVFLSINLYALTRYETSTYHTSEEIREIGYQKSRENL